MKICKNLQIDNLSKPIKFQGHLHDTGATRRQYLA